MASLSIWIHLFLVVSLTSTGKSSSITIVPFTGLFLSGRINVKPLLSYFLKIFGAVAVSKCSLPVACIYQISVFVGLALVQQRLKDIGANS